MNLILNTIPNNPGLATGINASLIGIGSLVFNFIGTFIINPDNHSPTVSYQGQKIFDSVVSERMPLMYEVISCVCLGIIIFTFILIKNYPPENKEEVEQISFKNSLRTRECWLLFICFSLTSVYPIYIVQKYKDIGIYLQVMSDQSLAILGSVGALLSSFCKVVFGHMNDKYGFKVVYLLLITLIIVMGGCFRFGNDINWVFTLYICISYVSLGGHFTLLAPICRKLFGRIVGMKVWGVLYMTVGIGTLFAFIAQILEPDIQNFTFLILCLSGLALVALACMMFFREIPIYQDSLSVPLLSNKNFRVIK
jgi:nitrate/nitrite transporter NarK